jgi:hypothetical protein
LLACVLAACATPAEVRKDLVLRRSSREWSCPRESVKVRHLGSMVYEAKGCGERATYACTPSGDPLLPDYDPDAWRCVLESRDGYRGPADRPQPASAAPAGLRPRDDTMPGWSAGGEAPTAAPDSAAQSSAPSGAKPQPSAPPQ